MENERINKCMYKTSCDMCGDAAKSKIIALSFFRINILCKCLFKWVVTVLHKDVFFMLIGTICCFGEYVCERLFVRFFLR
uniref:Tudor domain-containing protein n=1 Tax=Parascaris univalens TaxID=6257 RepID=A0A915A468_PARUN